MMKNKNILLIGLLMTAFTACQNKHSNESEKQEITEEKELAANEALAQKYGVENFAAIDTIDFTFNVRPNAKADTSARQWRWIPKNNQVALMRKGEWVTYKRDTIQFEKFKGIDKAFINDQYWLIFPFRTLWDTDTEITEGKGVMPFSNDTVPTMTITYTDSTGYSPNDTYKLFMDSDGMVAAWKYYGGSSEEANIISSWEATQTYKGIKIPTKFINEENGFAVFFTNIQIR